MPFPQLAEKLLYTVLVLCLGFLGDKAEELRDLRQCRNDHQWPLFQPAPDYRDNPPDSFFILYGGSSEFDYDHVKFVLYVFLFLSHCLEYLDVLFHRLPEVGHEYEFFRRVGCEYGSGTAYGPPCKLPEPWGIAAERYQLGIDSLDLAEIHAR